MSGTLKTTHEMFEWLGYKSSVGFLLFAKSNQIQPKGEKLVRSGTSFLWDTEDFQELKKCRERRLAKASSPTAVNRQRKRRINAQKNKQSALEAVRQEPMLMLLDSKPAQQALTDLSEGKVICNDQVLQQKYKLTRYMTGLVMRKHEAECND